jgi:hypothetical protein
MVVIRNHLTSNADLVVDVSVGGIFDTGSPLRQSWSVGTAISGEENQKFSAGEMSVIYRLVETFFHGQFQSSFSCHFPILLV